MRIIFLAAFLAALPACDGSTPPEPPTPPAEVTKRVFFVMPKDGETVKSPVKVKMGVEGMTVQPAGELKDGTGHHHIIINKGSIQEGQAVPADEKHIHYGKGQTETELDLPAGKHALTLQFANGAHQSYGEAMSATINITVEGSAEAPEGQKEEKEGEEKKDDAEK